MIKCSRCGKIYNYDKYNGICPDCCRYNRIDSVNLEQELHERYDSSPTVHSSKKSNNVHKELHERYDENQKKTHQKTVSKPVNAPKKGKNKSSAGVRIGAIIVVLIMVVSILTPIFEDSDIFHKSENYWDDNQIIDDDFGNDMENLDGVYVSYAWTDLLGSDLNQIDWEEEDINISDEGLEQIETSKAMLDDEEGNYYKMSIEIQNNSDDIFDLTLIPKEDILLWTDEEWDVQLIALCDAFPDEIEQESVGYIDCIIFVPDDVEERMEREEEICFFGQLEMSADGTSHTSEFTCYID